MNKFVICFGVWIASLSTGCGAGGETAQSGLPPSTRQCVAVGCFSGARYEEIFDLGGIDPNTLELKTCFNGVCETMPVRTSGKPRWYFDCSSERRLFCGLSNNASNQVTLSFFFSPAPGLDPQQSLHDGDRYEVSVGVPGETPHLMLDSVAHYHDFYPAGPECGPPCKGAELISAM
jgi:hypothetical protein